MILNYSENFLLQAATTQSLDEFESVVSQYVTDEEEGNVVGDESEAEEE